MTNESNTQIRNPNVAFRAATVQEMALKASGMKTAMGIDNDPTELIGQAVERAVDSYSHMKAFSDMGERTVEQDFRSATLLKLAERMNGVATDTMGHLELAEKNGISTPVQRSVNGAMDAAVQIATRGLRGGDSMSYTLNGPNPVEVQTSVGRSSHDVFESTDPDGQISQALIYEMLGVTEDGINEAPISAARIDTGKEFTVVHRQVETTVPGVAMEVRSWIGLTGTRREQVAFSDITLEPSATIETITA